MFDREIAVLRAEAVALDNAAREYEGIAPTTERVTAIIIFRAMAAAKRSAADQLAAPQATI